MRPPVEACLRARCPSKLCIANWGRRSAWNPGDVEIVGSTSVVAAGTACPKRYVRKGTKPICIGQKQRWFLLRFTGDEQRFRFDSTDQPEFDRWRWCHTGPRCARSSISSAMVYARALHELGPLAFPEGLPPYPEWWPEKMRRRSGSLT